MLFFYGYLLNILKVLSLWGKENRAVMGHNSHTKLYRTLKTDWMGE